MSKQIVIRILLLVAKIVADNDELKKDIQNLANHIAAYLPERKAA